MECKSLDYTVVKCGDGEEACAEISVGPSQGMVELSATGRLRRVMLAILACAYSYQVVGELGMLLINGLRETKGLGRSDPNLASKKLRVPTTGIKRNRILL